MDKLIQRLIAVDCQEAAESIRRGELRDIVHARNLVWDAYCGWGNSVFSSVDSIRRQALRMRAELESLEAEIHQLTRWKRAS